MTRKVKAPVKKGAARVPVIMQLEALECGAACLGMVLAYYKRWVPLEELREYCGVSRDGSNALNVLKAARHYGLQTEAYRCEPEDLKREGVFPCIIHWNFNHFVVLDGFSGNKAYLNDPARGAYSVPMETFDRSFTGVVLMMEPEETFESAGKPVSMFGFAKERLRGTGSALAFTAVTAVIAALTGLISPAFSKVFIDYIIDGQNGDWLVPFLVMLGVFNLIEILVSGIKAIYSLRINGKMAAVGHTTFMWKVLRLPMSFFGQRMAGDIQLRQNAHASIANTLITTFAPLVVDTGMMVFYLVVMLRHSPLLTAVGITALTVKAVVFRYISKKRVNATRVSMRDEAKLASTEVSGYEMIETIKASGAENGFFARWAGYQASVNAENVRMAKLEQYLGMLPEFVSLLADQVVLILGVWLVMKGEFTTGSIMAFQGFLSSFMSPAIQIVSAGKTLQEMRTEMERIDDVMTYPEDTAVGSALENRSAAALSEAQEESASEGYKKLSGRIELKHVFFGYSPLSEPLIRDFNLSVMPGQCIALVGSSGSGKSTISKLLSGLYVPRSGEILFDGKPLSEIDRKVFRGSLAVVDQDIVLMEDTIARNIKMWDESIEDFEMILAAHDASIHEDIMEKPGGYRCRISEGGKNLSGGQRQRIEIARALAQDPTIVILDEATSSLDAKTEYEVVRRIRKRGITCIVIAHRLSTIRSADEIIVMENGVMKDRGTHRELLEKSSLYRELVSTE